MCFDRNSSLVAWSLAYSISWFLFLRNKNYDRWNAAFILCFTTIQLLEAGMWSNPSQSINELLTMLVLLVLVSQPLVQSYMGYTYTKSNVLMVMCLVFLGIMLWSLYRIATSSKGQFSSAPGPRGHMVWTDSKSPNNLLGNLPITIAYFTGLMLPVLFMKNYKWVPLAIIGALTIGYSLFMAGGREFSSYWCFTSVAYAIVAMFL